jgi:hypothetical protein
MIFALPKDLQDVIVEFEQETDNIVNSFCNKMDSATPPGIIYHYTDASGLQGILESGKIRLTDIFNLNDPSELKHGCEPMISMLKSAAERSGSSDLQLISKIFSDEINGLVERITHLFVCCFSHDGNDLGQWRAYGDNGRGYALGFDCHLLEQAFIESGRDINATFPITYVNGAVGEKNNLNEMHQEIFSRFESHVTTIQNKQLTDDIANYFLTQLYRFLYVTTLRTSVFFKHKAYINEKEYRFLHLHRSDSLDPFKYRSRPYSLVRYKEFDWKSSAGSALKEIVIGPAADKVIANRFATDCMKNFFGTKEDVSIIHSGIPYRGS